MHWLLYIFGAFGVINGLKALVTGRITHSKFKNTHKYGGLKKVGESTDTGTWAIIQGIFFLIIGVLLLAAARYVQVNGLG